MWEKMYVVYDGYFLPLTEADLLTFLWRKANLREIVPLFISFLGGESVERGLLPFEVVEAKKTIAFKDSEHMSRLFATLKMLKIDLGMTEAGLLAYLGKALADAGLEESIARIDAVTNAAGHSVVVIKIAPKTAASPLSLRTSPHFSPYPAVKFSGKYTDAELFKKLKGGCDDVLYYDPRGGVFTETSRGNIFFVSDRGGEPCIYSVATKHLALLGITAQTLITILLERQETDGRLFIGNTLLRVDDLRDISEVFVTSSTKRIVPVRQIDDKCFDVGEDGKGGPATRKLSKLLDDHIENYYLTHK